MKRVRHLHFYLGTFFAPSIIFFALTGALQTFGLHESHDGEDNPAWVSTLAEVHIHQRWGAPSRSGPPSPGRSQPPNGAAVEAGPSPEGSGIPRPPEGRSNTLPLKIFVGIMALGLATSSLLGVYMAFRFRYDRRLIWSLLVLGTLLPALLLVI